MGKRAHILPGFLAFALFGLLPSLSFSSEKLLFNNDIPKTSHHVIEEFLEGAELPPFSDFKATRIDINADGMDEYILKEAACPPSSPECRFLILAEADYEIVPLGEIIARDIQIADTKTDGVRDIHVFRDLNNDFTHEVYIWDSERSGYAPKGGEE